MRGSTLPNATPASRPRREHSIFVGSVALALRQPEPELPPLRRLGLLRRGHALDRDPPRLEDLRERPRGENIAHLVSEHLGTNLAQVEVHVLRVPDAPMKEAEVAAALEHEQGGVQSATELGEEEQVELLDESDRADGCHDRPPNSMILLIFNTCVNYAYYDTRQRPPGWLASTVGETVGVWRARTRKHEEIRAFLRTSPSRARPTRLQNFLGNRAIPVSARSLEGLAPARAWGFESPLPHHSTRPLGFLEQFHSLAHGAPLAHPTVTVSLPLAQHRDGLAFVAKPRSGSPFHGNRLRPTGGTPSW